VARHEEQSFAPAAELLPLPPELLVAKHDSNRSTRLLRHSGQDTLAAAERVLTSFSNSFSHCRHRNS